MIERMRHDLAAAMKSRDRVTVRALRSAMAAIENAAAPPTDGGVTHAAGAGSTEARRLELDEARLRDILDAEIRERAEAARQYLRMGRDALAEPLTAEAAVLRGYLEN